MREAFGGLDAYFWRFVDDRPIQNAWEDLSQVPATTALSDTISKDLERRGFKFVGSTIVYAHMRPTRMVKDHLAGCFRHRALGAVNGLRGHRVAPWETPPPPAVAELGVPT